MANKPDTIQPKPLTRRLKAEIAAARLREAADRRAGLRAVEVYTDPGAQKVFATLTTGVIFGFPFEMVPGLEGATPEQLNDVSLSPSGSGIHFNSINADVSVPGLILDTVGRSASAAAMGGTGGRSTSRAKVAAARANGRRGGRPKLKRESGKPSKRPKRPKLRKRAAS